MANPDFTVRVADHGAVGDGIVDDTSAITRALAAAGPGGTVLFEAGRTYKTTSQITVPADNITLYGPGATITSATEAQFRKFLFTSRTRGAVIGLRFNCLYSAASTGLSEGVIEINASNDIVVRDCEFNEVAKNGVYIVGASARCIIDSNHFYKCFCAIFMDDDTTNNPSVIHITNNDIRTGLGATDTAFSGGIKISGVGDSTTSLRHVIKGNTIDTAGQMGIELHTCVNDCVVSGNTIKGTGYGISIAGGCYRTAVEGNTVSTPATYGIEVSGSYSTSLTGNNVYSTGANVYNIIVVSSALYTSITGGALVGGERGIYIAASNVSVTGVNISGILNSGACVYLHGATDISVSNNHMVGGATTYSYIAWDATSTTVSRISIVGNRFNGSTSNCCILFINPGGQPFNDILVTQNTTHNCVFPANAFNSSALVSGQFTAQRIRCFDNIGTGTVNSFASNLSVPFWSISTNATWPYGYYTLEGGQISIDAAGSILHAHLPNATGLGGYEIAVQKVDSSANPVLISGWAGQTIQGMTSVALTSQYSRMAFLCNGATDWIITRSGKA